MPSSFHLKRHPTLNATPPRIGPWSSRPDLKPPNLSRFGLLATRSKSLPNWAKKAAPAASTGRRSGQFGTLQGVTGGTHTHHRRTGSKLGRLPRARQAIVRVPESNTKYGGKRGKPRVVQRPRHDQVSVSPQGFPSRNIIAVEARTSFAPLFTGQLFIVAEGLLRQDSLQLWGAGLACPAAGGFAPGIGGGIDVAIMVLGLVPAAPRPGNANRVRAWIRR
jgi:hypothetical protein